MTKAAAMIKSTNPIDCDSHMLIVHPAAATEAPTVAAITPVVWTDQRHAEKAVAPSSIAAALRYGPPGIMIAPIAKLKLDVHVQWLPTILSKKNSRSENDPVRTGA